MKPGHVMEPGELVLLSRSTHLRRRYRPDHHTTRWPIAGKKMQAFKRTPVIVICNTEHRVDGDNFKGSIELVYLLTPTVQGWDVVRESKNE